MSDNAPRPSTGFIKAPSLQAKRPASGDEIVAGVASSASPTAPDRSIADAEANQGATFAKIRQRLLC